MDRCRLVERIRLPAIYPWRDYVEAGRLMAYGGDLGKALATHGR